MIASNNQDVSPVRNWQENPVYNSIMVSLCIQAHGKAFPLQMSIADHFSIEEAIGFIIDEFNSKVTSNKMLTRRDLFVLFK